MALRDWNKNGDKNDLFDNYMDYKLYQKWKENKENKQKHKNYNNDSSNYSGILFTVITVVVFYAVLYAISLERDFLLSLVGWSEYRIHTMSDLDKLFLDIITIAIDIIALIFVTCTILFIKGKIKSLFTKK